jgi:hypothetical protein
LFKPVSGQWEIINLNYFFPAVKKKNLVPGAKGMGELESLDSKRKQVFFCREYLFFNDIKRGRGHFFIEIDLTSTQRFDKNNKSRRSQ